MNELELKHFAPYVMAGVSYQIAENVIGVFNAEDLYDLMCNFRDYENYDAKKHYRLILNPLNDYQDITGNAMNNLGIDLGDQIILSNLANKTLGLSSLDYSTYEIAIKNHIDIFGMIEKGWAIDKKTVKL